MQRNLLARAHTYIKYRLTFSRKCQNSNEEAPQINVEVVNNWNLVVVLSSKHDNMYKIFVRQ